MATSVLGQSSKRERLGPVSASLQLKAVIYPLLDGTTRRKRGELEHANLLQSSTPDPSSVPVLNRAPILIRLRCCVMMSAPGTSNPSREPWAENSPQALRGSA